MPSLLIYGKGGESESIVVSKENIIEKVPNNTKTASLCSSKTWKSQRMERIDVGKKIDCGIQTLNFFLMKNFAFEFIFVLFTDKLGLISSNGLLENILRGLK